MGACGHYRRPQRHHKVELSKVAAPSTSRSHPVAVPRFCDLSLLLTSPPEQGDPTGSPLRELLDFSAMVLSAGSAAD
jgi:hypothetical protein